MIQIKRSRSKTISKKDRALELIDEAHDHLQEAQEHLSDYYGDEFPSRVKNNVVDNINQSMETLEEILVNEDL